MRILVIGKNWTEHLMVNIDFDPWSPEDIDIKDISENTSIYIERSVPFDEDMAQWWEQNYN
jgi:hypothetical protein